MAGRGGGWLWACRARPLPSLVFPSLRACSRAGSGHPDPGLLSPWEGCAALVRPVLEGAQPSCLRPLFSPSCRTLTPVFREASRLGDLAGEPVCALVAMSLHQAGLLPSHLHGARRWTPSPLLPPCSVLWDQSCSARGTGIRIPSFL